MKQTVRVSLGGYAFNFEEDAYSYFESYLNAIRLHLKDTSGSDEIISDIEERAAEILSGIMGHSSVITIGMVKEVENTIGKPEQIAGDEPEPNSEYTTAFAAGSKRRLFRDPDQTVFGGVCAGLAAFLGVEPILIRIAFLLLLLVKGLGLIIYLALWIIVPYARTARERLQMKGKPVNLSNLENIVTQEYEEVKKNLKNSKVQNRVESTFREIFMVLGKIFSLFFRIVGIIFGLVFLIVGLTAILAATFAFFFQQSIIVESIPFLSGYSPMEMFASAFDYSAIWWLVIPAYLIILIPVVLLVYLGVRILFPFRTKSSVFLSLMASFWALSIVAIIAVILLQIRSFTISETVTDTYSYTIQTDGQQKVSIVAQPFTDSLSLNAVSFQGAPSFFLSTSQNEVNLLGRPRIVFGLSANEQFQIRMQRTARGASRNLAISNAQRIQVPYTFSDSVLAVSPYFNLGKGDKWRMQDAQIEILIPDGMRIFLHPSIEPIIDNEQHIVTQWPDELVGKLWVMQNGRLIEQPF
jgi:phage shock protein PspC (stress-responsive transcriptional regulator)